MRRVVAMRGSLGDHDVVCLAHEHPVSIRMIIPTTPSTPAIRIDTRRMSLFLLIRCGPVPPRAARPYDRPDRANDLGYSIA